MGVAAEVLEEPLRPAEGALHVDEPGNTVEAADGAACRHGVCGRQLATGKAALEGGQYFAAKHRPEDTDREEMSLAGGTPAATVDGETGGHDAMDVRMEFEFAGPGVEHGRDAELGAEPLRIVSEGEECLGRGSQEKRKHLPPGARVSDRRAGGRSTPP